MKSQRNPDLRSAEKNSDQMNAKRYQKVAVITPDLLQPIARDRRRDRTPPIAVFRQRRRAAHHRLEGAEIQGEKKTRHCWHGNGQHGQCRPGQPLGAHQIGDDAEAGQQQYRQADNLEKNVDQNAGDRQTRGDAEMRQQPCADDVATNHGKGEKRIDRIADKPKPDKNAMVSGRARRQHQPPANSGAGQGRRLERGRQATVPHRELINAASTEAKPK